MGQFLSQQVVTPLLYRRLGNSRLLKDSYRPEPPSPRQLSTSPQVMDGPVVHTAMRDSQPDIGGGLYRQS